MILAHFRNDPVWSSAWDRKCSDLHAAWRHLFGTSTPPCPVDASSIACLRRIRAPHEIDKRMLGAITSFLAELEHTCWTTAYAQSVFAQEVAHHCTVSPEELLDWAGDHMIEVIDEGWNFDDVAGLEGLFYATGVKWFELILAESLSGDELP